MVDSPLTTKSNLAPPSQYSPEFLKADAYVAYQEGGKTADDGLGNPTAFGINGGVDKNGKPIHPGVDVPNLTPRQAQAIRYTYWQAINGDGWAKLDPRTALIGYDTAIMTNPSVAYALLDKSGGDPTKMYALRTQKINELAQNPKFAGVARNWAARTQDLGQTVGVVPGTPRTPPVEKLISADTVYVPTGYAADTNTPAAVAGRSIRHGTAPNVAQAEPKAETPPETPPEEPPNPLQEGISGALKAETQAPAAPAIPVTKPNIALPTGAIAPNQRELYAKALERISQRNASTPPTQAPPQAQQPQQAQQAQPQTATAPQQTAPVKEEQAQNEPEA